MPEQIKILDDPTRGRTYEGKYGEIVVWQLDTDRGSLELHKKAGNNPPKAGETVLGSITISEFRGKQEKRLKLEAPGGGGQAGGGRARDPKESARIERMAHHKVAAHLLAVAHDLGLLTDPETSQPIVKDRDGLMLVHKGICEKLAQDLPS